MKILGGVLGAEDEDSLTLRRRTLSHPELVASFRGLLEEYSREPDSPSFLVFIDELDKMSEAEQLIEVVNGLKDLFHIPGVHFIVSVSTDALARFEQRGVPLRDAFDSAFDTVLRVERLSYQESLTLIDARAAGFPPVLALLCHAWSGGLPRDLLRAARRCVEVQRSEPIALPLATIQRHLVLGDLLSLTESLLRSGPTIVSQGNDAGLDAAIGSSHLRQAVRSVQAEVTTVAHFETLHRRSQQATFARIASSASAEPPSRCSRLSSGSRLAARAAQRRPLPRWGNLRTSLLMLLPFKATLLRSGPRPRRRPSTPPTAQGFCPSATSGLQAQQR